MSKTFKKTLENFTCQNCGTVVTGTGYTNHCPNCLYSKHVDIFPGDRENPCHGLMCPIGLEKKHGELKIIHQCLNCKTKQLCVVSPEDNLSSYQSGLPRCSHQGDLRLTKASALQAVIFTKITADQQGDAL